MAGVQGHHVTFDMFIGSILAEYNMDRGPERKLVLSWINAWLSHWKSWEKQKH